ncbi:protein LTO1 homolog [Uranotaenia lowii]|uniref:protein LTO1 homolog n=1 Tax=Uranotaenia lowii TaxID=190385 RepID=UPI00247A3C66|nr:protein LTO1 homolog [Uranotaenia lowii]
MSEASNSAPAPEVDINDVFDDLLLTEERLAEESYEQGKEIGSQQGNVEAYHFGYHRGAEVGAELGFYYGVIKGLGEIVVPKAKSLAEEILKDIEEFPRFNDLEQDIVERLVKIRNRYKKLCALLKISAKFNKGNELSF